MKFTPKYAVSYHGVIRKAGIPFEIAEKDAEAMSLHGSFEAPVEVQTKSEAEETTEPEKKKAGRPKKN